VDSKRLSLPVPKNWTNCFGNISRESGHSGVPAPPARITGTIDRSALEIAWSAWAGSPKGEPLVAGPDSKQIPSRSKAGLINVLFVLRTAVRCQALRNKCRKAPPVGEIIRGRGSHQHFAPRSPHGDMPSIGVTRPGP